MGIPMIRHLMLVMTNALPDQDAEFNKWYDKIHLRDVLSHPNFVSAERFRTSGLPGTPIPKHKYAAIFEMKCDDPQVAYAGLVQMFERERMVLGDAMAPDISVTFLTSCRQGVNR